MTTATDCLAALMVETEWRCERGIDSPTAAVRLIAADVVDAGLAGDRDRLRVLWQELPAMLAEECDFHRERGCLPI